MYYFKSSISLVRKIFWRLTTIDLGQEHCSYIYLLLYNGPLKQQARDIQSYLQEIRVDRKYTQYIFVLDVVCKFNGFENYQHANETLSRIQKERSTFKVKKPFGEKGQEKYVKMLLTHAIGSTRSKYSLLPRNLSYELRYRIIKEFNFPEKAVIDGYTTISPLLYILIQFRENGRVHFSEDELIEGAFKVQLQTLLDDFDRNELLFYLNQPQTYKDLLTENRQHEMKPGIQACQILENLIGNKKNI